MGGGSDFEHDSPLWRYALCLYGRPGVQPWLLEIQGRLGLDVNFILMACWCGERGIELGQADWQELTAVTDTLRHAVIAPLRRQRVRLTGLGPAAVRAHLLRAELAAENALYGQLWSWCENRAGSAASIETAQARCACGANLATLARFYSLGGLPGSEALLAHLPLTSDSRGLIR